jgi:hypothetical protein
MPRHHQKKSALPTKPSRSCKVQGRLHRISEQMSGRERTAAHHQGVSLLVQDPFLQDEEMQTERLYTARLEEKLQSQASQLQAMVSVTLKCRICASGISKRVWNLRLDCHFHPA